MIKLFLDDEREPWDKSWDHVKSAKEFKDYIIHLHARIKKLPDIISFDHDLHYEHFKRKKSYMHETGLDCAGWLCEFCKEEGLAIPEIQVHSANKIGADKIARTIMDTCLFYYEEERIITPKPYEHWF